MACTFDSSSKALPDDGLFEADAAQSRNDGGGNVNPSNDGDVTIDPTLLNSDTVIVRYFINEGSSEGQPNELRDAIGNPELNLALSDPDGTTSFVDANGHHGIRFNEASGDARLSVAAQNTKIRDALDGSRTGTLELVLDISDISSDGSRISHIGGGTEAGRFTLRTSGTDWLEFFLNNAVVAYWPIDLRSRGRMVVHVVVDTSESNRSDRVRLYVDGQLQSVAPAFSPQNNALISISNAADQFFVLGNREVGGRSFEGCLFYAAMYAGAMRADVVSNNAALLTSSDDSAQITGQ